MLPLTKVQTVAQTVAVMVAVKSKKQYLSKNKRGHNMNAPAYSLFIISYPAPKPSRHPDKGHNPAPHQ